MEPLCEKRGSASPPADAARRRTRAGRTDYHRGSRRDEPEIFRAMECGSATPVSATILCADHCTIIMVRMSKSPSREWIAYQGDAFTIEWYRDAAAEVRHSSILSCCRKIGRTTCSCFSNAWATWAESSTRQSFAAREIRSSPSSRSRTGSCRFFRAGRKIVLTNAFMKKSAKLPPKEKERALRAKADYEVRVRKGAYYETE